MAIPTAGDAITAVLNALQPFLPAMNPGLPKASLSIARAAEKPACIGNVIGIGASGSIASRERHAIRMEATARFAVWGLAAADVDAALTTLSTKILASKSELSAQGFLKLSLGDSALYKHTTANDAWSACADYDVLFELSYEDADGATSLILPVAATEASTDDVWSVTADHARWDDTAAPLLSIRGPARFAGLATLSFFEDPVTPPAGAVTITRTYDGAPAPAPVASLDAFVMAAAGTPPKRNIVVSFASLAAFLAPFAREDSSVDLANALGAEDTYSAARLSFLAPFTLGSIADRFEIAYADAKFNRRAVVYLRALRAGG
ncbi:hypothetical protein [Caballeronia novacaledonica]|uniref:Uncharacterized protein n=1 Tax=Caballeronia novacaledonica TaxID=1544861 RepID=A0AA37MUE2_9BURK|nr:hypothetical protein [Caballeronia novacaledonica]GJH28949.1 hypothetical protein CBA19CS42_30555 [Caballeronia novacaledonica]